MKYLAVDPSSTVLGWALFDDEELRAWGTVDARKVPYDHRFMYINQELLRVHQAHGFADIACERAVRFKGKKIPALEVAVISIRKWAEMRKIPIALYSPAEWKKSVTGSGNATKAAVAKVVCLVYPRLPADASEHVTDAVGIGMHHWGIKKLERMATQGYQ
jgi:crossover junction endodeoxyribonuclease RuvC